MTDVSLNDKEQAAADAILAAMRAVRALGDAEFPANFHQEVIPAVHTLQMFVLMHWAHRIHPDYWSDWFWKDGLPPWIPSLNIIEDSQSANKVTPS